MKNEIFFWSLEKPYSDYKFAASKTTDSPPNVWPRLPLAPRKRFPTVPGAPWPRLSPRTAHQHGLLDEQDPACILPASRTRALCPSTRRGSSCPLALHCDALSPRHAARLLPATLVHPRARGSFFLDSSWLWRCCATLRRGSRAPRAQLRRATQILKLLPPEPVLRLVGTPPPRLPPLPPLPPLPCPSSIRERPPALRPPTPRASCASPPTVSLYLRPCPLLTPTWRQSLRTLRQRRGVKLTDLLFHHTIGQMGLCRLETVILSWSRHQCIVSFNNGLRLWIFGFALGGLATTLAALGLGTAAPDPVRHCLVPLELFLPDSGTFVEVSLRDALLAVDFNAQLGNLVLHREDAAKDLNPFEKNKNKPLLAKKEKTKPLW